MPPLIPAAIAAAGTVAGAALSSSAAKKAANTAANTAAADRALQEKIYNEQRADLAPYNQAGVGAISALQGRFGLGGPAPAQSAAPPAGGAAFGAGATKTGLSTIPASPGVSAANSDAFPAPAAAPYAAAPTADAAGGGQLTAAQIQQISTDRPDVLQAAQNNPAGGSVADNISNWYFGGKQAAGDAYALPSASTAGASATPAAPVPGQTFTSSNNGGLGDRPTFTRDAMARPDFTEAQPSLGGAPNASDYFSNFQASPGYDFRVAQGLRADNAAYAARGLLKSDAAVKALNDYSQGMASSEYGNWFNQQMQRYQTDLGQFNNNRTTGLAQYNQNRNVFNNNYQYDANRYDSNYNTDVNRSDAVFNADRGYNTDQYNTYTNNLFNLSKLGQSAAAGVADAGANYANNATATNNSLASVQGNAGIAGANSLAQGINGVSQALGSAFSGNPFAVSNPGISGPAVSDFSAQSYQPVTAMPVQASQNFLPRPF